MRRRQGSQRDGLVLRRSNACKQVPTVETAHRVGEKVEFLRVRPRSHLLLQELVEMLSPVFDGPGAIGVRESTRAISIKSACCMAVRDDRDRGQQRLHCSTAVAKGLRSTQLTRGHQ